MLSVLAICIGASLGALSRWGLSLWHTSGESGCVEASTPPNAKLTAATAPARTLG